MPVDYTDGAIERGPLEVGEDRLIYEPKVHIVAATQLSSNGIGDWTDATGLGEVLDDIETPLHDIWDTAATHEGSAEQIEAVQSAEALPEFAGRFCYRSFEKGRSHRDYIKNILEMGHGSVLEHSSVSFAIQGVSRSLSHELVRHRAGVAISQESQRYVDAKDMKFVVPVAEVDFVKSDAEYRKLTCDVFGSHLTDYMMSQIRISKILEAKGLKGTMLKKRVNEAAREYLPNACETRLVWSLNFRALRHVLELRGGLGADLQFRRLSKAMLDVTKKAFPVIFDDITHSEEDGIAVEHSKV